MIPRGVQAVQLPHACYRDNFITSWLRAIISQPHVHHTSLKVKFDIQTPWPNLKQGHVNKNRLVSAFKVKFDTQWLWPDFKVARPMKQKMACKRDNFVTPWARALFFSSLVHQNNPSFKFDNRWPWPNFKVARSWKPKLLAGAITSYCDVGPTLYKCYAIVLYSLSWLAAFIFSHIRTTLL